MYVPAQFNVSDPAALDYLAKRDSFGTLISEVAGAPFASQIPVLLARNDNRVFLRGHWARANPQWKEISRKRALFIFHGPHAYISPRWYPEPSKHVPTWNYATAHIYGRVRTIHDMDELEALVYALAGQYESVADNPWTLAAATGVKPSMLKDIVGFELQADEIQIKFKLSQNHSVENALGAIDGLMGSGTEQSREVANLMHQAVVKREQRR